MGDNLRPGQQSAGRLSTNQPFMAALHSTNHVDSQRARHADSRGGVDEVVERLQLVGCSSAHQKVLNQLRKVANTDAEVLIYGPTGVGKELYARYVHECSGRRNGNFTPVNCGAVPEALFENEMFGHMVGAFTGADSRREGLVAAAEGGTLFLDEVDALRSFNQVKLLRFLQEREYRRLGDTCLRRANVRIVAATNTDLRSAVREGSFREDLFFRLRVVPVDIPPLCERPDDIPVLVREFTTRYAGRYGLPPVALSDAAWYRMSFYGWPGNVRELENCVRFLTCQQFGRCIEPDDLPLLENSVPLFAA